MQLDLSDAAFHEWFFGNIGFDSFKMKYFRKKIYHSKIHNEFLYSRIFSLNDFDHMLNGQMLHRPAIRMAGEGRILPMSSICKTIPYGKFSFENVVDIEKVKQWYDRGYTINVRGAHFFHSGLGKTCEILRQMFKCNVRANLYLTPNGKSGLIPHYDVHDVIVIQVSGRKCWNFYTHNFIKPTERIQFQSSEFDVGGLTESIELNPGNLLYIPRGISHSAQAIDESLHVTLGIEEPTIFDVVTNLIANIEKHSEIRDSLEELFDSNEFTNLHDSSVEVMRRINRTINIEEISKCIKDIRHRSHYKNKDNFVRFVNSRNN